MIDDLKPYPEYRESGLPWLGKVPKQWSIRRIKTVLQERDSRTRDGHGTLLSLTRNRGLIPHREMTDRIHSAKTLVGYKLYRRGQIVMNRMQAWSGMFGAGDIEGLISPDYAAFDIVGEHDVRVVLERLKSPDLVGQFALESKGIGSGFNRLYTDRFGPIPISLPPPDEQAAIVRFLDHANRKIERAIRAMRKLIALLNEQRQAIIHRAVTRGLEPAVKLKPSGILWLGHVPEHWDVMPIKRLLSAIDYGTSEASMAEGRIRILTMGNIQRGEVILPKSGGLDSVPESLLLEHHDILFTRTNGNPDLVGKVGIFRGNRSDAVSFASYLVRLRANDSHDPQWLHSVLNSATFWAFARSHALVNLQTNLNSTRYCQFHVPVPPHAEQIKIMAAIGVQTQTLNCAIDRTEREIALIREYRTVLTAEVVTGKLDVREATARLPKESDEPASLAETEVLDEGDELTDDELCSGAKGEP